MPGDDIPPNGKDDEAEFERDVEGEAAATFDAFRSASLTEWAPGVIARPPTLTVAIATCRRPEGLRRALAALRPQVEGNADRDIVVVNDGSDDPAYRAVAAAFADIVRYVPLDENGGVGQTRNRCIAEATGDYVVFIDDDCVPPGGWLDRLEATLRAGPDLDVVAGTTKPLWDKRTFLERVQAQYALHPHPWPEGDFHLFVTANVALRRSLVADVGGFAPLRGGEDSELSVRLVRARAAMLVDWDWHVFHEVGGRFSGQMRRFWGYGYFNMMMTRLASAPPSSATLMRPKTNPLVRIREHVAEAEGFSPNPLMRLLAAGTAATFGLAHYLGCAAAARELRRERRHVDGLESAESPSEI